MTGTSAARGADRASGRALPPRRWFLLGTLGLALAAFFAAAVWVTTLTSCAEGGRSWQPCLDRGTQPREDSPRERDDSPESRGKAGAETGDLPPLRA